MMRPSIARRGKNSGFTLIEVLVIVMLVGIVVGGVSVFITSDGPEAELKKTVEKFVVIGGHVAELSVLSGEPIGMFLEPPEWRDNPLDEGWRYSWKKQAYVGPSQLGEWQELPGVPAVDIEKIIELRVHVDEQEWKYEDAPKELAPILVFYPSGEVTPFEIEFMHKEIDGDDPQTVMVDVWGEVVWKQRREQQEELEEDS